VKVTRFGEPMFEVFLLGSARGVPDLVDVYGW
jgi:hypothetical protein